MYFMGMNARKNPASIQPAMPRAQPAASSTTTLPSTRSARSHPPPSPQPNSPSSSSSSNRSRRQIPPPTTAAPTASSSSQPSSSRPHLHSHAYPTSSSRTKPPATYVPVSFKVEAHTLPSGQVADLIVLDDSPTPPASASSSKRKVPPSGTASLGDVYASVGTARKRKADEGVGQGRSGAGKVSRVANAYASGPGDNRVRSFFFLVFLFFLNKTRGNKGIGLMD